MTRSADFASGEDDAYDYVLAERLSMPVWVLRAVMPAGERAAWQGYDRYKAALQKRAREKARLESKSRKKRRKR